MKNFYRTIGTLALLASTLIPAWPAHAVALIPVITVNSAGDAIALDGVCTLREAIQNANNDAATNADCAAGSGADTITFAANYTITLGSQLPDVTSVITINGTGSGGTIIQANASPNIATYRIFEVGATGNLALSALTVQNGRCNGSCATDATSGGGVFSAGILSVTNSVLSGNISTSWGGGIFTWGPTLTVTNSVLTKNSAAIGGGIFNSASVVTVQTNSTFIDNVAATAGGAIYNSDALYVTNSTFSGNSATTANGGAIYNDTGTALVDSVTGSTFSGNSATTGSGGAIFNNTGSSLTVTISAFNTNNTAINGGGIFNYGGTLTVNRSTFSANSATNEGGGLLNLGFLTVVNSTLSGNSASANGGGIFSDAGTLNVISSTLSGNSAASGGGLYNNTTGSLNYINTIIANSAAGGDCTNVGTLGSNTKNLVKDGSCSAALSGDPKLGPLASNGGATQTMALLTGSPAIDAGDDASCAAAPVSNISQNGLTRPQGAHCDIGSFEAITYYSLSVKSLGAQDGWVLESSETSNKGGTLNKTAAIFNLGDDATKKQYRAILSFATGAALPDTAVITAVTLKVKKQAVIGGGNPVAMFRGFLVDLKTGTFGTAALQPGDFQAAAGGTFGPFMPAPISKWYSIDLTGAGTLINKLATGGGLTQIRLRFKLDDNNNAIANTLSLFSGNALAANRPQLIITYYLP